MDINSQSELKDLQELAVLARRSIEPGLQDDQSGGARSSGACLHACLVVVVLLRRFGRGVPVVRGGSGSVAEGAIDATGQWRGHYWVVVQVPGGSEFVVDITADQFGYESVIVMPLEASSGRYRSGSQIDVDTAFNDLAVELDCEDLI